MIFLFSCLKDDYVIKITEIIKLDIFAKELQFGDLITKIKISKAKL